MIDRDQAIEIARKRSAENGWAFAEPVEVVQRRGWFGGVKRFDIETNAGRRGTKARFAVDAETGRIISEGYTPR
ncbi:hypothetical protein KXS07_30280 [Inquilinus limosus]|uniref:hypothetical protein n=1 Tax=Inquilinus limosus TaxID=171674 RepID=UPI003F17F78D